MITEDVSNNNIVLDLTKQELLIFSNVVSETLKEIEDWEFFARVGTFAEEARKLTGKINGISASMPENSSTKIALSKRELKIIGNSFNEVINGFHLNKFEQRIGVSENDAILLHKQIRDIFRKYWQ